MIGKLLYRYRTQFGHGFRTAWQRDVVRWRVLNTSPVRGLTDGSCEIHVLTCERDWLDLIWCLKSFFSVCEVRFRLCIHDDGSVRPEGLAALASHFPDARVICRSEADEAVGRMLRDHPRCNALRRSNNLALKVFDFLAYLESDGCFCWTPTSCSSDDPPCCCSDSPIEHTHATASTGIGEWATAWSRRPSRRVSIFLSSRTSIRVWGSIQKASYDLGDFERWLEFRES